VDRRGHTRDGGAAAGSWRLAGLGGLYLAGVGMVAVLLLIENFLVRPTISPRERGIFYGERPYQRAPGGADDCDILL